MSITDELRTGGIYRPASNRRYFTEEELTAIAGRIDAEHESACAEAYGNGVMSVPIALDESAWVELPKDADGVPFRIGDEADSDHYEDGTVIGIQYFKAPNGVVFEEIAVQPNGWDTATWRDPDEYRHHHEPTVEDVLREFAYGLGVPVADSYVAAAAAKLRLAGDAE